jgi:pyruvate dehydrogenase E1 component beta subunit
MLTYMEAQSTAFREEMLRDERVVLWGEDIVSMGGVFREAAGVFDEFGEDRIKDTPVVESAIVEMAVGAALTGLRPVAFVMFGGFIPCCGDAVLWKLGSYYQEWEHRDPFPVVIHSMIGGRGTGPEHCVCPEAFLIHSPGLKVVLPSNAYDAKGLLKAAVRDDYPVVYLAHTSLVRAGKKEPIPVDDYVVPLGKADIKRQGTDVTLVTYSAMVDKALSAAEILSEEGIDIEIIDLRSLVPLDIETVVNSIGKTRHLIIVHEAMKRGGVAGEIVFRIIEEAPDVIETLKSPIKRLAAKNIGLPHGAELESKLIPQVQDIVDSVKEIA